jgi:2-methylisocitrate lyase-like PEP mutase family enzyme
MSVDGEAGVGDQVAKARRLRELHLDPQILVLVNVWDVASARTIAALPGCPAVATGSWPISAALGVADGEVLTRDEMLAVVARIVAAVDLPVTADLEAGYGQTPRDVSETIARAIAAGVVGCNIEDRRRPVREAALRVAAARERAEAEGVPLVLNARMDLPFNSASDMDEAVARGRAYLDAGADCVFPIRARGAQLLSHLVAELNAPVNAFGVPGGPSVRELNNLGVARVSFGPGPLGAAMAALGRVGADLLAGGAVSDDHSFRPPTGPP